MGRWNQEKQERGLEDEGGTRREGKGGKEEG